MFTSFLLAWGWKTKKFRKKKTWMTKRNMAISKKNWNNNWEKLFNTKRLACDGS